MSLTAIARIAVLFGAVISAMPRQFEMEGGVGGDISDCSTSALGLGDCTGCEDDWYKCVGCQADVGDDKESICVTGDEMCTAVGCTKRNAHDLDDNCVTQVCPDPS
jgi:hypothetical protein